VEEIVSTFVRQNEEEECRELWSEEEDGNKIVE